MLGKRKRSELGSPFIPNAEGNWGIIKHEALKEYDFPHVGTSHSHDDDDDDNDDDEIREFASNPPQGEVLWSESQEQYPRCAAYDESVQLIRSRFKDAWNTINQNLMTDSSGNSAVQKLLTKVTELLEFPNSPVIRIALLGDAGTGKSSLINSMVDSPNVAKEGNSGKSCTCVIHEYCKSFPGQTKKFAAKIKAFEEQEIGESLRGRLTDYQLYNFFKDKNWTSAEEKEQRAQAETAAETFLALFRTKPAFQNRRTMRDYIHQTLESIGFDNVLAQFVQWSKELISENALFRETGLIQADDSFKLATHLRPFVTSGSISSTKPSLWPIVEKVSIGIHGPRVLNNIVLVDLPGISDTNVARVKTGQEYLKTCDGLWIVTPIGRCITDTTVDDLLSDWGERFHGRLAIICTNIDVTGDTEELAADYEDYAKPYFICKRFAQDAGSRLEAAREQNASAGTISVLEDRLQKCLDRKLESIVQIRNKAVEEELRERKSEWLFEGSANAVYFVSNKHYAQLQGCKEKNDRSHAQLGPTATGIPRLREFALQLPSHDIWDALSAQMRNTSSGLMQVLQIWANVTGVGKRAGFDKGFATKRTTIRGVLLEYQTSLAKEAKHRLVAPVQKDLWEISNFARDYLNKIHCEWKWNTIQAFIRNEGSWETQAVGRHSWNREMAQLSVETVNPRWEGLVSQADELLDAAEEKIMSNMDATPNELNEAIRVLSLPMGQFKIFVETQKKRIEYAFRIYRKDFQKSLSNIKHATTKDSRRNYLARAMLPAYQRAQLEHGKHYKPTVMNQLISHVTAKGDNSPFVSTVKSAESTVVADARRGSQALQRTCEEVLEDIFSFLGSLVGQDGDDNRNVLPVKLALQGCLPGVVRELVSINADGPHPAPLTVLTRHSLASRGCMEPVTPWPPIFGVLGFIPELPTSLD